MLETDCLIPTKPVPIPHPDYYTLYGTARAVKALLDEGLRKWEIIKKLRISEDAFKDAIFEINRQKAVEELRRMREKENEKVADGKHITEDQRAEMYRLWKDEGKTQKDIAEQFGFSANAVCNAIKAQKIILTDAQTETPQENEQTDKPVMMTEEHTAAVPDAVIEAVREQIKSDELFVADNLSSIRKLQQENEQYRTKIAALKKWLAEVTA